MCIVQGTEGVYKGPCSWPILRDHATTLRQRKQRTLVMVWPLGLFKDFGVEGLGFRVNWVLRVLGGSGRCSAAMSALGCGKVLGCHLALLNS